MKISNILVFVFIQLSLFSHCQMKEYRKLTPDEKRVIVDKGTEFPNSGEYNNFYGEGVYKCKRCDSPLFTSESKFKSGCGWPSFDDFIDGAVTQVLDADGRRTEIICSNCKAHLGHVFMGEGFTEKNTRHCVNSISLVFQSKNIKMEKIILASGCFWGTEYWLAKQEGVVSTRVGFTGGTVPDPSYKMVCTGKTGHAEAVEVVYDPTVITIKELLIVFFNTHDPTQIDGQGPDIGNQYRSEIFFTNDKQETESLAIISILKQKGYNVATKVTKFEKFWSAEENHQKYYMLKGETPYCHIYVDKFQ